MGLTYADGKTEPFKWTDQYVLAFCDIINQYHMRGGRNSPYKWTFLQLEFEKIVHHQLKSEKVLRKKFDSMRNDYNLWKSLKNGENGISWNVSTGKLDCSDDWWRKKIKVMTFLSLKFLISYDAFYCNVSLSYRVGKSACKEI